MPCGGSTQVFAFAALSSTSQLSLASCMTASSLLDFAAASPAFNIFLHTHCEEIVLAALRKQYGYIPDWGLLPHHTNPSFNLSNTHLHLDPRDAHRTIPRTHACRRHRRSSHDTQDLLAELPMLQRLLDEELLPEHGKNLLSLLPSSPQALPIYGPGIRGLLRYRQKYALLLHDGVTRADLHYSMQQWLEERYTTWGIKEMVFVVDALSSRIDTLLPSLRSDPVKREQLVGSLLFSMEVLWLGPGACPLPAESEQATLQKLADRGTIEFLPPLAERRWKVTDSSHAYWFSAPAYAALSGIPLHDYENERGFSPESPPAGEPLEKVYVLGRGQARNACGEKMEDGQASSGSPANAETPRGMMLMMMAGAVARGARTKRAEAAGVRRENRPGRGGFVDRGVGWGWDVGCLNRWYGSNN